MAWTPPSKFIVFLTFLMMALGIFILLDLFLGEWAAILPAFDLLGYNGWFIISLVLFFFTWFFFFLGVKLKGL